MTITRRNPLKNVEDVNSNEIFAEAEQLDNEKDISVLREAPATEQTFVLERVSPAVLNREQISPTAQVPERISLAGQVIEHKSSKLQATEQALKQISSTEWTPDHISHPIQTSEQISSPGKASEETIPELSVREHINAIVLTTKESTPVLQATELIALDLPAPEQIQRLTTKEITHHLPQRNPNSQTSERVSTDSQTEIQITLNLPATEHFGHQATEENTSDLKTAPDLHITEPTFPAVNTVELIPPVLQASSLENISAAVQELPPQRLSTAEQYQAQDEISADFQVPTKPAKFFGLNPFVAIERLSDEDIMLFTSVTDCYVEIERIQRSVKRCREDDDEDWGPEMTAKSNYRPTDLRRDEKEIVFLKINETLAEFYNLPEKETKRRVKNYYNSISYQRRLSWLPRLRYSYVNNKNRRSSQRFCKFT